MRQHIEYMQHVLRSVDGDLEIRGALGRDLLVVTAARVDAELGDDRG